ncbi:MAG TPA: M15 family metallopeptidase [Candidatus Saccharimonadales bacterium]|nr:M15 family metallopeptidase [Candidatus Saccharimonadales bacterium]
MKKKIIILIIIVAGIAILYFLLNQKAEAPGGSSDGKNSDNVSIPAEDLAKYTVNVQESIYYIVNKNRHISASYVPNNLVKPDVALVPGDNPEEQQLRGEAATAAKTMFEAAEKAGFSLVMASGYRSAQLQEILFNNYAARDGEEAASKYSARPGTSEHQTGLALDVTTESRECYLDVCFAETPEGKWLKNNAHKYGFHLRYQKGKEDITGYQFEPWHFRYVGNDLAKRLHDSGQTMEEFFGILL